MVASNVAKGQKTRAMLVTLLQGAPANMRHKPVGATFDPEQSEALAFIKSRLQGDPGAVSVEAQRLFNLAKEHRVIRYSSGDGTWHFTPTGVESPVKPAGRRVSPVPDADSGPQIFSRFGNAPVLKITTWANR